MYAAVSADRLRWIAAVVGAVGCALMAVGLPGRWPSVLPVGLAAVGASYGVTVALSAGAVDARAPAVAAALFVAAELAFWSLEREAARYARRLLARRLSQLAAGALATALVGTLVLVAASGESGGVGLEAAGIAAALLMLGAIAWLASRASV